MQQTSDLDMDDMWSTCNVQANVNAKKLSYCIMNIKMRKIKIVHVYFLRNLYILTPKKSLCIFNRYLDLKMLEYWIMILLDLHSFCKLAFGNCKKLFFAQCL